MIYYVCSCAHVSRGFGLAGLRLHNDTKARPEGATWFNDGNAALLQVAGALSALESVAGAVRVSRFDHSSLSGFDSTDVNTDRYKMEYIVNFEGAARSGDLPLLTYGRNDDVNCGNHMRRRFDIHR